MPRSTRSREDEIVRAAAKIFHDKGYSATSVADIADSVGLLKGSLYHYIKTKEDLLYLVMHDAHARALDSTQQKIAGSHPLDALRTFVFESVLFVAENPEKSSAFQREVRHLNGEHLKEILRLRRENEELLESLIRQAQEAGLCESNKDARLLTLATLGLITSLSTWYRPSGRWKAPEVARQYTEIAFAALGIVDAASEGTAN